MSSQTILLFGKDGQVGSALQKTLKDYDLVALGIQDADFAQIDSLDNAINSIRPGLIINAVAYNAVDDAEEETSLAHQVNGNAVGYLAQKAYEIKSGFIHYSTDYVFDGTKGKSYLESDAPNPVNEYGKSKLYGEKQILEIGGGFFIFRTSWVYTTWRENFVTKVLRWARHQATLRIVDDQIGSPTWTDMLAEQTRVVVDLGRLDWYGFMQENRGIYHLAGKGAVSRFDWAEKIIALDPNAKEHVVERIEPADSREFPTPAARPKYSALNCEKVENTFGLDIPDWVESLRSAMRELSRNAA